MSSGHNPCTSLDVLSTACAPSSRATRPASAFAPPAWPDNTLCTKRPDSSQLMTAGSRSLPCNTGAIERTQMPSEPIKRKASKLPNECRTNAGTLSMGSTPSATRDENSPHPANPSATSRLFSERASAIPVSVMAIMAIRSCMGFVKQLFEIVRITF